MQWRGRKALVTGGASFIGSHLVDALVEKGAAVRVVDDLSSGSKENLKALLAKGAVEFIQGDLRVADVAVRAVRGIETAFHLAAAHGGRGYVDLHQGACAENLMLDGLFFKACREGGVEKIVFASSGCVYPNYIQTDPKKILYLKEEMVGPPYDSDNLYGWAKLMGEMALKAYHKDYGMKSASCRFFTVYGPRGIENHAGFAMIARAFVKQDPFVVWGTGQQIRNWTYVNDIVAGTLLAAEKIDDATAVNVGTMERVSVLEAVEEILRHTGHKAKLEFHPEMPTGPYNRVADNSLAKRLLGWEPQVPFKEGLHRTIDWYFSNKDRSLLQKGSFDRLLTERGVH